MLCAPLSSWSLQSNRAISYGVGRELVFFLFLPVAYHAMGIIFLVKPKAVWFILVFRSLIEVSSSEEGTPLMDEV